MNSAFRTFLSAVCLVTSVTVAQAQAIHARPTARIHDKIDKHVRQSLAGTHPEVIGRGTIGSRLASATQLKNLVLVLEPTADQKAALKSLLDAQQDKSSPNYHKWLTPDSFATDFGVAPSDINQVTAYLSDSGLNVEKVSRTGRFIVFSGTAGAVESAFGTQLHHVTVDGEAHISNTTDLTVPAAIAPVVHGLARVNDFKPRSSASDNWKKVSVPVNAQGKVAPEFGGTATGTHYVGAGDIAKIYNAAPVTNAGHDGTGVSISVIAQSNIQLSDVQAYRSLFGLPKNDPSIVLVDQDPGENSDDLEAFLDAEMAGALATGAHVNFVVSSPQLLSGGIDGAALYIVDNNLGDIVTMSYGGCEKSNGASYTAFWNTLWEIAAAQGQTVFVSSGDSGASGCTSSSATSAGSNGFGVNALGSSAYNVAVGGTMFVDFGPAQYWGAASGIPYTSALGYIPEAALNQSRLTSTLLNSASTAFTTSTGVFAGGGGISIFTSRPSWQTGSGISPTADPTPSSGTGGAPTGVAGQLTAAPRRLVPDVSFISAYGHDGTLMCGEGYCNQLASGGLQTAIVIGGTSVAAPAMASAQALINSYNGNARQGNANYYYYALAQQQYTNSTTACQSVNGTASNPTVTLPASTCNFNDVIAGNITVPTSGSGSAGVGFAAGVGYDAATGLGSPNIGNLAMNWSSVNFKSTTTTLSLTPTSSAHGTNVTAAITVTGANGTPKGDVGIVAVGISEGNYAQTFTLSNGAVNGTLSALPGGSYNVYAHYAGDGVFAASDSAPVAVTVSKEDSVTTTVAHYLTSAGNWDGGGGITSHNYGTDQVSFATSIVAASDAANGIPSGNVTYSITRNGTPMPSLSIKVDGSGYAYLVTGPNLLGYYNANYQVLPAGAYSVVANYSGDNSFNASSATTAFTVNQITPTVAFTSSTSQINSGDSATLNYSVTTATYGLPATGSVTFTDTTTSTVLGTVSLTNGKAILSTSGITASGAHTISASYAGDNNYKAPASNATVTVTVGSLTAPTLTLTNSASPTAGASITLTATISPKPSATTVVYFYDGGALLGNSNASTSTGVATLAVTNFTGGTHSLTASFTGNASQKSTSGSLSLVVAQRATTTLISGGESAKVGQTVYISGAIYRTGITANGTAPVVPVTGTVTFYDGSTSGPVVGTATPVFGPGVYADPYVGTINTNALTAGTHNIIAVYSGDASYAGSSSNAYPVVVSKTDQTIPSLGLPATATYGAGAGPYVLPTTASSGLPISYSVSGPATLNGNVLTITGAGTVIVTATQAGDANYNAATPVNATIVVGTLSASITQTIANNGSGYVVSVTMKNSGTGTISNAAISSVILGSTSGTPASQPIGTLAPGASVTVTFTVPYSAGAPGSAAVLKIVGTYTGGSINGSFRVSLPQGMPS